jgi:hypothetical protein
MTKKFNWDSWDTKVELISGNVIGDIYRADNLYTCVTGVSDAAASPSGDNASPALSGCKLFMPPRIEDFNIIESSCVQFFIYGERIN